MQAIGQQPHRAPDGATVQCERRGPEQTTLYRLVQQHAATFIAHTGASTGAELPQFIKAEPGNKQSGDLFVPGEEPGLRPGAACKADFDAFLECGALARGFLSLRCGECGHDKLLRFSRWRRGFCPSCGARRMSQTAAPLVEARSRTYRCGGGCCRCRSRFAWLACIAG